MLYNPAWRDPAPLTLPKLINWLERQPAAQEYNYVCPQSCLISSFLRAHGYPYAIVNSTFWRPRLLSQQQLSPLPPDIKRVAKEYPRTYSAALARARTALAEAKMTPAEEPVS